MNTITIAGRKQGVRPRTPPAAGRGTAQGARLREDRRDLGAAWCSDLPVRPGATLQGPDRGGGDGGSGDAAGGRSTRRGSPGTEGGDDCRCFAHGPGAGRGGAGAARGSLWLHRRRVLPSARHEEGWDRSHPRGSIRRVLEWVLLLHLSALRGAPGVYGQHGGNEALRDHADMRKTALMDGLTGKRYTALQRLASILPRERNLNGEAHQGKGFQAHR